MPSAANPVADGINDAIVGPSRPAGSKTMTHVMAGC